MQTLLKTGIFLIFLLFAAQPAVALNKGELLLWKKDPFFFGACGHCSDLISISENENDPDLRRHNFVSQTGEHTLDLTGPAGTTVTLFGGLKHALNQGYLIVTKQDGQPIELTDLGSFPQRRWVEVLPQSPGDGAYRVWYQPYDSFSSQIFSVRWGQWWEQSPPAN